MADFVVQHSNNQSSCSATETIIPETKNEEVIVSQDANTPVRESGQKKCIQDRVEWSEKENEQFRQLFPVTPNKELVVILNRSLDSIKCHAKRLRLKKGKKNPIDSTKNGEKQDFLNWIISDTTKKLDGKESEEIEQLFASPKFDLIKVMDLMLKIGLHRFFRMYVDDSKKGINSTEIIKMFSVLMKGFTNLLAIKPANSENIQVTIQKMQQIFIDGIKILENNMTEKEKEVYMNIIKMADARKRLKEGKEVYPMPTPINLDNLEFSN